MSETMKCMLCGDNNLKILNYKKIIIQKCGNCEFQYIPEKFKYIKNDHFLNYFDKRNEDQNFELNELRREQYKVDAEVISQHLLKPNPKVLDVGCSAGMFISEIYERCKTKYILGIDIDKSAIDFAREKYSDYADFLNINLLDVDDSNQFDLIVFRGTFQYLDQSLHESLRHIKRLLALNGKVLIFSLPSTDAFLYRLLRNDWALFHPEMSLMFNEKSIKYLFSKNDMKIDDLSYPYLNDVYSDIEKDYENVKQIIMGKTLKSNPFWGSIMQIVVSNKV